VDAVKQSVTGVAGAILIVKQHGKGSSSICVAVSSRWPTVAAGYADGRLREPLPDHGARRGGKTLIAGVLSIREPLISPTSLVRVDGRTIRLGANRDAVFTNVSLLDHLMSVVRGGLLVKKEVVNRVSDAILEVPIVLPADSGVAFDDLGDCDSDICGGVFSVKSEYRPNLEFEHAIQPAPAFRRSA
jgi:hypothetical protein